jgi:hypothetical protein
MAVLLADRTLGVRRHSTSGVDGHGARTGVSWGALQGPWPGRAEQGPDEAMHAPGGRAWVIGVDDRAWPITQGDMIVDTVSGEQWLVTSADLLRNTADPSVDYIRVQAHTRDGGTYP